MLLQESQIRGGVGQCICFLSRIPYGFIKTVEKDKHMIAEITWIAVRTSSVHTFNRYVHFSLGFYLDSEYFCTHHR